MIPIILGAAALGSAAYGALKGAGGVGNINQATQIGERAQKRHEVAVSRLTADWEATNKLAQDYGELQIDVKIRTIGRFVAFIERIGQRATQSDLEFLEGLEGISAQQIKEYKAAIIEAEQFFKGGVSAAITGAAAGSAAVTLAQSVGTATVTRCFGLWTTEVAISQLGGAAARNAAVAWLGGGLVLGGITLGPALMIGGFQLAGKGEEALTKAREYEARVNTNVAKIETSRDFLRQVRRRITELSSLVETLNIRAVVNLNDLESQPFDCNQDASKFQEVMLLAKALAEIIKTPILDNEYNLNPATATIKAKYRTLGNY